MNQHILFALVLKTVRYFSMPFLFCVVIVRETTRKHGNSCCQSTAKRKWFSPSSRAIVDKIQKVMEFELGISGHTLTLCLSGS